MNDISCHEKGIYWVNTIYPLYRENKSFAIFLLIIGWNTCNLLIEQNFYVSEHFTKWNISEWEKKKNIINWKLNPILMMFLFLLLLGNYCIRLSKEYANNAFSNT